MEQVSAQTEKITTYETSRTRRSIVDGNVHSDDSNNDEEFATSGFYVREKSSDKKPDSSDSGSKDCKETNNEVKENGIASDENSSSDLVTNGETSKDGENSRDSKPANEENNEVEPETKDDPETDKEVEESNKRENTNEESESKSEENNVTSSSGNEVEENVCSTSKMDEENDVSSTSHNVDEPETLESVDEPKKLKNGNEVENVSENNIENEPKVDEKETVSDESKEEEKTEIVDNESKPEENEKVDVVSKDDKKDESIPEEAEKVDVVSKDDKKDESIPEEAEKVDVLSKDDKKDESIPEEAEKVDAVSKDDKKDESVPEEKEKVDAVSKDDKKDESVPEEKEKVDAASKDDKKENDTVDLTENETSECKEDPKENDKKENDTSKGSILKEHLEKASNGNEENSEHEMDMDEDFDPSLLCPDISMDVDEAPVNTNTEPPMKDGSVSPLPYEPIFSTLVDEITGAEVHIDLTPEEMELRQKMFGPSNPVQTTKIHCTACNVHLGSAMTGANNRFVHPLLKVLICKNCYHFYTSGEFEKDEDGSELYCRWCGQGGQVLCCSSCEFVFCKRCIRNNFGQRKFKVIRDSEDWNCFKCEPEQLSNLRVSCAEFMEYYRTELARAQSLADKNPELMTTDYTKCCSTPPEKKDDAAKAATAAKARRKRKDNDDPDFVLDEGEPPVKKPVPTSGPGYTVIPPGNARPIVPKPIQPMVRPTTSTPSTVFKVGSTTFKTKTAGTPGYSVQKTATSQNSRNNSPGYITIPPPAGKTATTSPGYIKIIPQQRMTTPNRTSGTYTVVSGTSNGKPTFNTVRAVKPANQMPTMKHEWFEKTVRAAARVNSNLSYTLTQLNRQQSQAISVEGLAMVHNKLQEVLSTSINSLIQIRKNLRTEFIAGIKNIKFPPKPAPIPATSGPIVVKDDDDVIFVNPTTTTASQPPPLVLSPSVTISKKNIVQRTSDPFSNPKPSTSGLKTTNSLSKPAVTTTTPSSSPGPIKRGFLKVRSFTALQSVPSECITIPDDPLPAPIVVEEEDPLKLVEDDPLKADESKAEVSSTSSAPAPVLDLLMVYNVKEKPTREIQKMMNAVVLLRRSPEVDKQSHLKGLIGGDKKKEHSDSKKIVQRENGIA